jgi:hypothetical protein
MHLWCKTDQPIKKTNHVMPMAFRPGTQHAGMSRKRFLQIGCSGVLGFQFGQGLSLPGWRSSCLAASEAATPGGKARSCIILYCCG